MEHSATAQGRQRGCSVQHCQALGGAPAKCLAPGQSIRQQDSSKEAAGGGPSLGSSSSWAAYRAAFHPPIGILVGVRDKSTSFDPRVPLAGTVGTAKPSRTLMRRRCIIRMGKVGASFLLLSPGWEGPQGPLALLWFPGQRVLTTACFWECLGELGRGSDPRSTLVMRLEGCSA